MNKEQFLEESKNHEVIYGFMYGAPMPCGTTAYNTTILDYSIEKIKVGDDGLYYQWGWPGPDGNFYDYEDYGIFWAFERDDIDVEAAIEKVKS